MIGETQNLKRKLEESERRIQELVGEIDRVRRRVGELEGVEREQRSAIGELQRELGTRDQNAKRVIEQGVGELKNLESELLRTRDERERLKEQISSNLRETTAFKDSLHRAES